MNHHHHVSALFHCDFNLNSYATLQSQQASTTAAHTAIAPESKSSSHNNNDDDDDEEEAESHVPAVVNPVTSGAADEFD